MTYDLQYTEMRVVDGSQIPVKMSDRVNMLDSDIGLLRVPTTLPTADEVTALMSAINAFGNNLRRTMAAAMEKLTKWEAMRERTQRSVGGSDQLVDSGGKKYADTGTQRPLLQKLSTAVLGPEFFRDADGRLVMDPSTGEPKICGIGLREGLMEHEIETAMQILRAIMPAVPEEKVVRVKTSFDEFYGTIQSYIVRLKAMEAQLESLHYDVNNLVKMLEMASFEARRTQTPGG